MTPREGAGCASGPVRMKDASRALSHRSPADLVPSNSFLCHSLLRTIFLSILWIFLIQYSKVCLSLLLSKNNSGLELLQLQAAWELHPLLGRSPWK